MSGLTVCISSTFCLCAQVVLVYFVVFRLILRVAFNTWIDKEEVPIRLTRLMDKLIH